LHIGRRHISGLKPRLHRVQLLLQQIDILAAEGERSFVGNDVEIGLRRIKQCAFFD
jgi:hypothetical protein